MPSEYGWEESAPAYIAFQDAVDKNRTMLLDPVMLEQCGDVAGKRVLDVGCGEGRFCRMLAERGASVVAIDPTYQMVRTAQARESGAIVQAMAELLPFDDAALDLVVSYVSLVDIPGYQNAIAEMARVLRPGGRLVVANLGFVSTANGWIKDAQGKRLHYPVDGYAEERCVPLAWCGIRIFNWHRPLSAYMQAYLGAGLALRAFLEPVPQDQSLRNQYEFEDWFRVPLFTVMRWEK